MHKIVARIHEMDPILILTTQVATLTKKLDSFGANSVQSPFVVYEYCGYGHLSNQCPSSTEII